MSQQSREGTFSGHDFYREVEKKMRKWVKRQKFCQATKVSFESQELLIPGESPGVAGETEVIWINSGYCLDS